MADDGSDFARSMSIATRLRAQAGRMRVISENIANADPPPPPPPAIPTAALVPTSLRARPHADAKVVTSARSAGPVGVPHQYEPSNPAADASGNVKYPNVNPVVEMTDMREAAVL
jgi:flagellar basal-body rod protein FlgC